MYADRELNETAVKLQLLESSRVSAWNSVLYLPSLADIVLAQNIIVFTKLKFTKNVHKIELCYLREHIVPLPMYMANKGY